MKLLSEVRLGPRHNPLNLEMILFSLRPGSNTQSLRRKSLTDCLVLFDMSMFLQVTPITLFLYGNVWVLHG